jgi:hypothetical protein
LIALATVESLIAGRQTALLQRWLDSLPVIDVLADAVRCFLDGDMPAFEERIRGLANAPRRLVLRMLVRQFIDPSLPASREADEAWGDQRMRPALAPLFGRMWKRSKRVPEWIRSWMARTPASGILIDEWIHMAELAAASLEIGRVDVEIAQQTALLARSCREHVAVARIHARYLGELAEARDMLQEAEAVAERTGSSEDWSRCAVAWMELFAEPLAARRCAHWAEDTAKKREREQKEWLTRSPMDEDCAQHAKQLAAQLPRDWRWVARARAAATMDAAMVGAALKEGSRLACRSGDHVGFAEEHWVLLRDRDMTRHHLDAAKAWASDATEWAELGVALERLLGESKAGFDCLATAGSMADSAFGWQALFIAFQELGAAPDVVLDCADRALKAADASGETRDWCVAICLIREALGSDEQADGFLIEAARLARGVEDWVSCARAAATPAVAADFLCQAQEHATTIPHSIACAEAWIRTGRDPVQAQRCLLRAELRCVGDPEWSACAHAWETLFRDAEAGRRCRARCQVQPPPPDPELIMYQTQIQ